MMPHQIVKSDDMCIRRDNTATGQAERQTDRRTELAKQIALCMHSLLTRDKNAVHFRAIHYSFIGLLRKRILTCGNYTAIASNRLSRWYCAAAAIYIIKVFHHLALPSF